MDDPQRELAAMRRKLERQERIVSATRSLHSSLDLDEVLRLILEAATAGVEADRGTVFLVTEDGRELWSRVLSGGEHTEIRLPVGRGISGRVAATGETVRIADAWEDPDFDRSWDEKSGYRTRQILAAPIRNRENAIIGVFQLLNRRHGDFGPEDEEFLDALSLHAALAVENARLHLSALETERLEREMSLALSVQRQLLPEHQSIETGGYLAAGMNELCEDASGDYYDLLPNLPGGRLGFAIGDVSGHGLQAALIMTEARALLRATLGTVEEPSRVLPLVNDLLVPDLISGKFITIFAGTVEKSTGLVRWCGGGHPPPFHLVRKTGEIRKLGPSGPALGMFEGAPYRTEEPFILAPGDILLAYTDGATEARDATKEVFEEDRLADVLRSNADEPPDRILAAIRRAVLDFTGAGDNEDDLTLLAVKRV